MSIICFSCLCMFIVFAQQTESRVLILRDYDDEPFVLGHVDRASVEEEHKQQSISSNYRPKRTRSKKTVLQYGRHIYHLDNSAYLKELNDLRSLMSQLKPDSISYDYVDISDIFRSSDSTKNGGKFQDLFIISDIPLKFCDGDRCGGDLRKFSKHKNDDDRAWKNKKTQFGRMKRFQVVDNWHKSENQESDSSEEYHEKIQKVNKKIKKKKKKLSSESAESKSKESGSAEKTSQKKIKKKKPPKNQPKSSEESVEIKKKQKKKQHNNDSADASGEHWRKHEKKSKRNEDFQKKKKKRKKNNNNASGETKRKTFNTENDYFMQGNKIYHAKEGKRKKKHHIRDRRRRLEHFLPKRYHWDPSEIHDLGYYWFNGPKGVYPAPQQLYK